ncbi:DUF4352 domain-containing protein [Thermomonospora umbrina]|uniref:Uncharacterized protein DUF4352 n=1 Tax=Thermomonospora umbrina TaxID=111806 RepID=A0A3D9SVF5_9ACTN|nr:DUF4352 domain-containing protein [Thermomonospora umbrina]REE99778.1 uncharacterized protein DUF4352 [Thermomonospora umbrina]
MRSLVPATGLLLLASLLTGCSGDDGDGDGAAPAATYLLPARTARPDEKAVRPVTAVDGDTSFTVIGITTGLPELAGSHADVKAEKGQFVRIRLILVNNGRTTALVDVMKQRLRTADGASHRPDLNAMLIKRQPQKFDAGAAVRVEFDIWYDIPTGARPTAMTLYGGSTLTDLKDVEGTSLLF